MTEAAAKRKRKRPLLRALLAATFVLVIAGGIIVGLRVMKVRVDVRPQSEAILRSIADGKAADVYQQATENFQELILEERFLELAETMNQTLGAFKRTIDVVDSSTIKSASGRTGRVVLRLEFENAETNGDFSFLKVGKKWRLLGMSVKVPAALEQKALALERDPKRSRAPRDVVKRVVEIGKALEKSDLDTIYKMMSPPFRQSVSRADLAKLLEARARTFGTFKRMLDVLSSTQSRKKDRAEVSAVLEFTDAKATVHLAFIKSESGEWLLSGLKIPHPDGSAPVPN